MRFFLLATLSAFAATPALAGCSIHNDTGDSFTIESGNTSNQRVGGHTTTSIAAGAIKAKSDAGPLLTGTCKDGQHVEIKTQGGAPVLTVK